MPGQIGLIQATEVIKLILKKGKPLIGRFLIYNALELDFTTFTVGKNPSCHLCGEETGARGQKSEVRDQTRKIEDRKIGGCEIELHNFLTSDLHNFGSQ